MDILRYRPRISMNFKVILVLLLAITPLIRLNAQSKDLQPYAAKMAESETLIDQNRFAEGIQLARFTANQAMQELKPSSNAGIADMQLWLGHRYVSIRHFQEAQAAYEAALAHRSQFRPKANLAIAETHFALALSFLESGIGSMAESHLQKAMELQSKAGIGIDYCKSLEQYAGLQLLRGQDADAETQYLRLSKLQDSLEGPLSPSLARTLNNLGGVYLGRGFDERAKAAYEQAINIQTQTGAGVPLSTTLTNLGVLYDEIGEYPKALAHLQRAYEIRKEKLLPNDPLRLTSIDNLINLMVKQQDFSTAEKLLLDTKQDLERKYGGDSPFVAEILDRFAMLSMARENGNLALAYFLQALQIRENSLGAQSEQLAANLYNLGKLENLLGKTEQARIHLNWGLDIYDQQQMGNESQVTALLSELFVCDYVQGKLEDAEHDLTMMRAIKLEVYGPNHPETIAVMEEIVNFYKNTGRQDEAADLEAEIIKISSN